MRHRLVWSGDREPSFPIKVLEGASVAGEVRGTLLARTETMLLIDVHMQRGAASPPHEHPGDSIGYLIEGRVECVVDGERVELGPGDSFYHPPGVTHSVRALQDAHWVEIKSPPREPW
jgi:quercetin dioxygenase-like cupin family protein